MPPEVVHEVLDAHGRNSRRIRAFPAVAGVYYGMALSLYPEASYEAMTVQLDPGDRLVMYTDGVTEAEDEDDNFFGEARLQAVAEANLGRSVDIIEGKVVTAVLDFVGDAPQFDDITLMLLARES